MAAAFGPAQHLKGYLPDLPTPFDVDGELDLTALTRLCHRHVADGGGAFVICTATGEAPTLTQDERIALIRCAVQAVKGRVPVIAGTSSNDTARAIAFARDAAHAGTSAIIASVPYYNKPTQAGLFAHFSALAEHCDVPIILHDEPDRCVRALDDDTVLRLVEWPKIVALCDASGDLARLARLRARVGRGTRLLSSDDVNAPAFIAMGGDGCISGACAIAPLLCRAFYNHASQGDMAKARRLSLDLGTLTAAMSYESGPAPLKHALALMGAMSDTLRLPLLPASKPAQTAVAEALAALQGWLDCDDKLCVNAG